jgi:hypothetical protein
MKMKQSLPITQAIPVIQEVVVEQPKIVQSVQVEQPVQKQSMILMQTSSEKQQKESIQFDSRRQDAIVLQISDRTVKYRQQRKSVKQSEKKSRTPDASDRSIEALLSTYPMFKMSTTLILSKE